VLYRREFASQSRSVLLRIPPETRRQDADDTSS